jgi:hypothetical protein
MWGKTPKWLANFLCLLLDSNSVSYWNICRIYSDFADKKSLMFIGKIVDRMDTYLPTSHLQSMKTPLNLNTSTWLVWLINPLSRLIKMNFIDMRIFFNTAYLYLKTTVYSLAAYSYLKSKFKMVFICEVITEAGIFVLTLLKLYFKFYAMM